mmetsp:Transcript_130632/g.325976  ORF Transcript_130632/g.325976 Transcript_130632/m.325976 type:complete len:219 (+) Transcript_130632:76-732(+)
MAPSCQARIISRTLASSAAAIGRAAHGSHRPARRTPRAAVTAAALVLAGCIGAVGLVAQTSRCFAAGSGQVARPSSAAADLASHHHLSRRSLFFGGTSALAGLVAGGPAEAIKDAREDSICTVKCLDICNEKAPGNTDYCKETCDTYCKGAKNEKRLNSAIEGGSSMDKILKKARTGKFSAQKQDDKKVSFADTVLGRALMPTNVTDYANGMKETITR